MNNLLKRIEINPKIMYGKPVIKGTRIPVEIILKKLSQYISIDKVLEDYNNLTGDDIKAAVAYASSVLSTDEILAIPVKK
ncbi:MAG: DUF433 domain-containing protein [Planctomycetota bacterium]